MHHPPQPTGCLAFSKAFDGFTSKGDALQSGGELLDLVMPFCNSEYEAVDVFVRDGGDLN